MPYPGIRGPAALRTAGVVLLCLWLAACSGKSSPARADFAVRRHEAFATWQKGALAGTNPAAWLWECALCPKLHVHNSGAIWSGSPEWDTQRQPQELPLTNVQIPRHFAIGSHEVTRGEFNAFVEATQRSMPGDCQGGDVGPGKPAPGLGTSFQDPGFVQDDDHPAVCVSWQDATDYVAWLNTLTPGGYRLPTEAEWQFAGYGGGYENYVWGETVDSACPYANVLDATAQTAYQAKGALACNDGWSATAPVGSLLPSAGWSFDVIGNAAEWTATCDPPRESDAATCERAIVKGGSWRSTGPGLRLAARNGLPITWRDNAVGFRVAKSMGDPDAALDSVAAYLARGRQFLGLMDYRRALADFERAVELDQGSSQARSARGWAHFRTEMNESSRVDFEAALSIEPNNVEAITGLGALALIRQKPREALQHLDQALVLAPEYIVATSIKAVALADAGDLEDSLAVSARGLQLAPTDIELLRLRVHLRGMRREWTQAVEEVDRLSLVFPTLEIAQSFAASAYSSLLRDAAAVSAATRALRASDTAKNYLLRAHVRPWEDIDGRRADIDAALKLEPDSLFALHALGELESRLGNHEAAVSAYDSLLRRNPDADRAADVHSWRGIEYFRLRKPAEALKDFEAVLGKDPEARVLNNLCWKMALAGVALHRALDYCNRAVAMNPKAAGYIDSKGMVLLRLGRWEEAIAAFDAAIKLEPDLDNSLYGRGIARQSRCKCEAGSTDLKRAVQIAPPIQRRFERLGMYPPFPPET